MESILFLAHTDSEGKLPKAALEALAGALMLRRDLGGVALNVGLVGSDLQAAADSISACDASKYYSVGGPEFGVPRYSTDAAAFETIIRQSGASIIIAPATSRISRALPGVAVRLNGKIDTHICALSASGGAPQAQRWYYRQRLLSTFGRSSRPWCLVVDAGVFEAFKGERASTKLEAVNVPLTDNHKRTSVIGLKAASSGTQTIRPEAKLLFVAGAGWSKKQADGQAHLADAATLIMGFLQSSAASLGSSKSLVDQSCEGQEVLPFLTHLNQVGQTGASPRHPKGLATCCHGEEPHVVGWRFINERRAVNLDANCGWAHGKADVLYVADAFKVIENVNALLKGS